MANDRIKSEPSLQDIQDEIELYQVLLKSTCDSANPDEELIAEFEEKLAELQQQLETLQPLPQWDGTFSETSSQEDEADARSQSTTDVKDEVSSTTSYQNINESAGKTKQLHQLGVEDGFIKGEPSPSSSSLAGYRSASDPFGHNLTLPTRKRPFSGDHDYSFSKSMRTTPSPAASAAATPNSASSEFDDLVSKLLGEDVRFEYKDYEREQREWDARQEQERRDAELARSIQESWNSPIPPPMALPMSTIQTSLGSSSGSIRAMPPPPAPKVKAETSSTNRMPNIKHEPFATMPGSFPGTWRASPENSSSNSSDLEEILPSQFTPRVKAETVKDELVKAERNPYTFYDQPWNASQSMTIPQYGGAGVYNNQSGAGMASIYGGLSYGASQASTAAGYGDILGTASNYMSSIYNSATDLFSGSFGGSSKLPNLSSMYPDQTKTREELKSLLENIRPDEEVQPESREGTPEAMKCTLMEHQKLGLAWMKKMEESTSKGGILADDMGLGKTVQALSLIVSRKSENPGRNTTLIVAPVALMGQWAREIKKLLKGGRHSLTVEILHSNSRNLQWSYLRGKDVVLTTYGTLASEMKRKHNLEEKLKRNPNANTAGRGDNIPLLGDKSKWYRVILDEAQWIKNKSTKTSLAASSLQAEYRWCLTGTPMQNSVDELYSLVRFLRIAPYNSWERFSRDFSRPLKSRSDYVEPKERAMRQLQALCKAIMLRRTKTSKIDGKPILQLPEKTIEEKHAVFSKDEQDFYNALETRTRIVFNKYLKANTVGKNYSNALVLLLRLRQACCHPHLIKDLEMETNATAESIDKLANAQSLPAGVVERIKQVEAFECPICFDAAINSLIFNPCGHPSCNECFDRLTTQAHANADNDGVPTVNCPSCRSKVDPTKLTDFNSFKKAFGTASGEDLANDIIQPLTKDDEEETDSESDSDSEDSDDDVDDGGDLRGFIVPDDQIDYDSEDDNGGQRSKGKKSFKQVSRKDSKADLATSSLQKPKDKGKRKGKERASSTQHLSLADLRKQGLRNKAMKRRYLRRLEKNFQTSAKIDKTLELLEAIEARGTDEKTIVFSQFTSLLDLIEVPLSRKGILYKRYDGSMNRNDREEAVIAFTDDPRYSVMLVSLKAGNSGLNLTVASQVIILDPHWNW
jgi:SNF2 family DNA or RNA helicase